MIDKIFFMFAERYSCSTEAFEEIIKKKDAFKTKRKSPL